MGTRLQINLKDCKFFSYHGFYPEEQVLGNTFRVTVSTEYLPEHPLNDQLENTLDYEVLYGIIKEEMGIPRKLLETVAFQIRNRIQSLQTNVERIHISIRKEHPPFGQDYAASEVIAYWEKESTSSQD